MVPGVDAPNHPPPPSFSPLQPHPFSFPTPTTPLLLPHPNHPPILPHPNHPSSSSSPPQPPPSTSPPQPPPSTSPPQPPPSTSPPQPPLFYFPTTTSPLFSLFQLLFFFYLNHPPSSIITPFFTSQPSPVLSTSTLHSFSIQTLSAFSILIFFFSIPTLPLAFI